MYNPLIGKVKVLVARSSPTLCDPMDCSPPGSSAHGLLHWTGKNTGVGCHSFLLQVIFSIQGVKDPALQENSLLFEPPEKHLL